MVPGFGKNGRLPLELTEIKGAAIGPSLIVQNRYSALTQACGWGNQGSRSSRGTDWNCSNALGPSGTSMPAGLLLVSMACFDEEADASAA